MKYRIRKKGDKHVLEKLNGGKIEGRTLNPEKLWDLLEVSQNVSQNVSDSTREEKEEVSQKFSQEILSEGLDELPEPTDAEIEATLKEITK